MLSDEELEECKRLLIKQKGLLVNRWNDEDTLERLLRARVVWASPEWSGIYRRIPAPTARRTQPGTAPLAVLLLILRGVALTRP